MTEARQVEEEIPDASERELQEAEDKKKRNDICDLNQDLLNQKPKELYAKLLQHCDLILKDSDHPHPITFWNFYISALKPDCGRPDLVAKFLLAVWKLLSGNGNYTEEPGICFPDMKNWKRVFPPMYDYYWRLRIKYVEEDKEVWDKKCPIELDFFKNEDLPFVGVVRCCAVTNQDFLSAFRECLMQLHSEQMKRYNEEMIDLLGLLSDGSGTILPNLTSALCWVHYGKCGNVLLNGCVAQLKRDFQKHQKPPSICPTLEQEQLELEIMSRAAIGKPSTKNEVEAKEGDLSPYACYECLLRAPGVEEKRRKAFSHYFLNLISHAQAKKHKTNRI